MDKDQLLEKIKSHALWVESEKKAWGESCFTR